MSLVFTRTGLHLRRALRPVWVLVLLWAGVNHGSPVSPALAAAPSLSNTYQKMVETDPYDAYALRRLLEVNKAPGSLKRLTQHYTDRVGARPNDRVAWALIGHLRRVSEDAAGAVEAFERLAQLSPGDARPHKAIAEVWRQSRRWEPMLRAYQEALTLTKKRERKSALYEEASEAALEAERPERALAWLGEYRALDPGNVLIGMACAELLTRFGKTNEALDAWRHAEQSARAQLSDRVVIWRHTGTLLEEIGKLGEAEALWRKAMKKTPSRHWSRPLFLEGLARVHRRTDRLPDLVEELRKSAQKEPQLRGTLAGLYDELGQPDEALSWLTRAIKANGRDTELHERRIEILRRRADVDALDQAYQSLIRAAPREARYGLEYAEELFRRGMITRGLKQLDKVTATSRRDPGVWQRAISIMIGYAKGVAGSRLREAYTRLIRLEPREPAHHIGLGEHLWESGDKKGAERAWRRLVKLGRGAGGGHLLFAEVLADHQLDRQARASFEAALAAGPDNVACLEAAARWLGSRKSSTDIQRATALWTRLLELGHDSTAHPRAAARRSSARRHLVSLWERIRAVDARLERLAVRVKDHPTDLSAGLLLTELRLHLGRIKEAHDGLEQLASRFPEHLEVLRLRVTLALRQQALPEAIELLRKIATLDTAGAGEALHRAAQIAKALEDHEAALELTEAALRLRPEDAKGQVQAGELRLGLGDRERAASAWREALRMNPRDDELRFKLAMLYRDLGDALREERLLVELVRDASANGQVQRAGRRLLNLGLAQGRLGAVERVLRPLAVAQGRRSGVHRRLLIDLYLMEAQALSWELSRDDDSDERLRQLGSRALEILLSAVNGTDAALRARALTVLRLTRPVGAVTALARMLEHGDGISRLHAAVTLGFIGSESSAEVLSRALDETRSKTPQRSTVRVARELHYAAIWALGRVQGDVARERLLQLTSSEHASHHPMVALALAHHPHSETVRVLSQMALRQGTRSRQAALWALAHMERDDALPIVAKALRSGVPSEVEIALWALGRAETEASRRLLFDALMNRSGPAPHLIVRALVGRIGSKGASRRDDPYTRLIDLERLRVSRGVPDPGALISATVLQSHGGFTRARTLRFLETLDLRYQAVGRGDDLTLVRKALASLTERGGLSLPMSWRLTGLSQQELDRWAYRLASRMEPVLRRALRPTVVATETLLAIDTLVRLVQAEPNADLRELLLPAVERLLAKREAPYRARLWRAVALLEPDQISRLVRTFGARARPDSTRIALDEELSAFASAAGMCPTEQAQAELEPLLRSPSARVRLAAVQSVSPQLEGLSGLLVDLLEDPVVEVARQAAHALSRNSGASASSALERIRTGGDPRSLLPR